MSDTNEIVFSFEESDFREIPAAEGDEDQEPTSEGTQTTCTVTMRGGDVNSATGEGTWTTAERHSFMYRERGLIDFTASGKWRVNGDNIDFHVEQYLRRAMPPHHEESREGQIISRPAADVRGGTFAALFLDDKRVTRQQ